MRSAPIPPGWTGGFAQSDPAFAYPTPNFSSLDLSGNMDNINLLKRQQKILWPEFSWESDPGASDPRRCFQMFAPDISRFGYTDAGRVYSIICPQQGACSPVFGCFNVEVTVTGTRGWVDESNRELAADMSVTAKIWFTPSALEQVQVKLMRKVLEGAGFDFPFDKAHAINVTTHLPGDPNQPVFPVKKGEYGGFESPAFARHDDVAWSVGNLEVEIGPIEQSPHRIVNDFNTLIMEAFNTASSNMLLDGNTLTWNVWLAPPELVDQREWEDHARYWRDSIDADHGSPGGHRTTARYFDGSPLDVEKELVDKELSKLHHFLKTHL